MVRTLFILLLSGVSLGYLWHLTRGQAMMVLQRQSVEEVLRDTLLNEEKRKKIRWVADIKTFALEQLGLDDTESYSTFVQLDGPYVSYNLSAAPKDALRPYEWCFPIVGCVPYKGFFDGEYALREQQKMDARGYDTYLRGVRAFSTLGYFKDPIVSSMLSYDESSLAETVIHELVHQTVWVKDQVSFNESLAEFVGEKGTLAYLAGRHGEESSDYQDYLDFLFDSEVFEEYMYALISRLDSLYQLPLSRDEKLNRRERIFEEARRQFHPVTAQMKTTRYRDFFSGLTLNNAVLLSFQHYHYAPLFFDETLESHGGDLREMIAFLKTLEPNQIRGMFRTE